MTGPSPAGPLDTLCAMVLAGGAGRRMGGVNKALLEVGGVALIDRILARLRPLGVPVGIIANDPAPFLARGVPVYPDVRPGAGALGGILSALDHAPTDLVFVCGCDMPFISSDIIRALAGAIGPADAAVPRDVHGLQPLHAVYRRRAASRIPPLLDAGALRIGGFLDTLDLRVVPLDTLPPVSADSFFNVNAPSDLEQAQQRADRS